MTPRQMAEEIAEIAFEDGYLSEKRMAEAERGHSTRARYFNAAAGRILTMKGSKP